MNHCGPLRTPKPETDALLQSGSAIHDCEYGRYIEVLEFTSCAGVRLPVVINSTAQTNEFQADLMVEKYGLTILNQIVYVGLACNGSNILRLLMTIDSWNQYDMPVLLLFPVMTGLPPAVDGHSYAGLSPMDLYQHDSKSGFFYPNRDLKRHVIDNLSDSDNVIVGDEDYMLLLYLTRVMERITTTELG